MERKDMGMNDILPLELIHRIFLRVPAKDLFRLRFVSKLWHSLISDRHFAESHYNLYSAASSHSYYFLVHDYTKACFVQLHTLFDVPAAPTTLKEVSLPPKKNSFSRSRLMGSCRGFLLFNEQPHFLVIWNPLTGSSKTISYSHIVSRIKIPLVINPDHKVPYGFGFDASRDDYLVVLSWPDNYNQHHLDCFSLRTNSWINLDAALPKSMGTWKQQFYGLFLHGAIHWLCYSSQDYIEDAILIFDLKEKSFSKISMPKQLVGCSPINLTILGGCLALYWYHDDITEIWVMKEYKVPSSWILICEIPCGNYLPLCISNGSDIIALNFELGYVNLRFTKYNVSEKLLNYSPFSLSHYHYTYGSYCVHTDSLLPFPGVTLRIRIKRRKLTIELAKNVSNNLMKERVSGASIYG